MRGQDDIRFVEGCTGRGRCGLAPVGDGCGEHAGNMVVRVVGDVF